jgi:hypothetical protein
VLKNEGKKVTMHMKYILSELHVCGLVHHSIIHIENPTRCNIVSKLIIPYLYEAQHNQEPKTALAASGLHTWKVVGRVVAGR